MFGSEITNGASFADLCCTSTMKPSFGNIYCHRLSHINVDEWGATEFYTGGAKLVNLEGINGKIIAEELDNSITGKGVVHHTQPSSVSITQLCETGVAYQIQDDLSDFLGLKERGLPGRDLKEGKMNILIMHFIQNATQGEKFILQKFLKKRYDSISEDEITFWLKMIEKKGALDLSFNHLKQVSERAIEISDKTDKKLFRIVSFVISSIITRITRNTKKI